MRFRLENKVVGKGIKLYNRTDLWGMKGELP
jgi:hypothetical protein